MRLSHFKSICLGALLASGCVMMLGSGLTKWVGQFIGDGSGLTNVAPSGPLTNPVIQIAGSGSFSALWPNLSTALSFSANPNPIIELTGEDGNSGFFYSSGSDSVFLSRAAGNTIVGTASSTSIYDQSNHVALVIADQSTGVISNHFNGDLTANHVYGSVIYPTNFTFGTITASSQTTNYILNCAGPVYQKILASSAVNFQFVTNGPGSLSVKVFPNGGDRLLTFPTNWTFLSTNAFILTGSLWSYTLTNAPNGNGARVGWLSVVIDDPNSVQTNVVAKFVESP